MALKFRRGTTAQKSGSLAFGEPYINTTLGTLQVGLDTGDVTLLINSSSQGISGSSLDITGNAKIDGNLTLGGNITIGDNTSDTVTVTANLSSSLIPSVTNTFDLGSPSKIWRDLYLSTGSIKLVDGGGNIVNTITNANVVTTDSIASGSVTLTNSLPSGVVSGSSQVIDILSSLNTFSSSNGNTSLNAYTASNDTTNALQTTRIDQLAASTASLNSFTASNGNTSLNAYTASNDTTNTTQNTRLTRLEESTASINLTTASLNGHVADINAYTSSNDTTNALQTTRINQLAASTASINLQTASVAGHIVDINTYTSSLKTAFSVSGEDLTVFGNLTVQGDSVTLNVSNLLVEDKVIEIASGSTTSAVANGAGIFISGANASILWDHAASTLDINKSIDVVGNITLTGTVDNVDISIQDTLYTNKFSTLQTYTASVDSTLARLIESTASLNTYTGSFPTATATFTNKTISGASNTLSNIGNASLTNSSISIAGSSISLGGTISAETILGTVSTTNLSEGTNLYYTDGRVKTKLNAEGVISSSAQLTTTFDSRYLNTVGDDVVSGSSQISYVGLSNIPTGIVSGSSQIAFSGVTGTVSNAQLANSSITIAGQSTSLGETVTADTIRAAIGTVVTGSAQINFTGLSGISANIISSSSDTANVDMIISGGSISANLFGGVVSGSSQINLASVTGNSTSNVSEGSNLYYTDTRVKTKLDAEGVLSGSTINGSKTFSNNVTITGDLTVNGTTTTVNSNTVNIGDNIIVLNSDETGVPSQNAGIEIERGTSTNATLIWDEANDYWKAGLSESEVPLVTTTGTQTLTNKTISGASNTLSNIANASLTNSSITIAGQSTELGSSVTAETIRTAIGTVVTGSAQIVGSSITTNTITIGSTSTALGGTSTTLAGLTSVASTGFTGALTGNASTATTLQTARTINGTSFDGSANITIANLVSGSSQIAFSGVTGTVSNSQLANSSISIAGQSTSLGGSITAETIRTAIGTVVTGSSQISHDSTTGFSANRHIDHTAVSITAGTGLSGGGDISTTRTLSIDSTVATLTGTQTLTNKTISGASNTLTNIANASLTNSSISIAGTATSLGGSISAETIRAAIGTVVTGSAQITGIGNAQLTNSSLTVTAGSGLSGGGAVSLGSSITLTNAGVTSNVAGTGISVSGATGAVTISNTGVTSAVAGTGVSVSGATGAVTISIGQSVATSASPTFAGLTINGSITATGDITAFFTSDKRYKDNVEVIPNALDKVKKLNGVTWEWNDLVDDVTKQSPNTGLIAQEVQEVLPQVVKERGDGYLGLDYSKMMGLLVEAIKEQQLQIENLKIELTECRKQNGL